MVDLLRELARAYPEMTATALYKDGRIRSITDRFGTLQAALAFAGIVDWPHSLPRHPWTKPLVIAALLECHRDGLPVTRRMDVYAAAVKHFGSLAAAQLAAGLESRRSWSKPAVVRELRRLAREHGIVTVAGLRGCGQAVARHFGSVEAACASLGLRCSTTTRVEEQVALEDVDHVVDQLRTCARSLGRSPLNDELPYRLQQALLRHFESFDAARTAAGLEKPEPPHKKWSHERVLEELRREHARGTRITESGLTAAGNKGLVHAIRTYVGSLPQARRLAKVPEPVPIPRSESFIKKWDAELVLSELRDLAAAGQSIARSKVPNRLLRAAQRYWDSYQDAVEAAGFDYDEICLGHSYDDDELLARLRALAAERPDMTVGELAHHSTGNTLMRRFGSVEIAARRAKLVNWPLRVSFKRLPVEMLRGALQRRLAKGLSLARGEVERSDPRLVYGVERIHPVWAVALAELGVTSPVELRERDARARKRSGG
ncbi:MAG: hypothetical protein ABI867_37105 [Kofleriaceae bacterium]